MTTAANLIGIKKKSHKYVSENKCSKMVGRAETATKELINNLKVGKQKFNYNEFKK